MKGKGELEEPEVSHGGLDLDLFLDNLKEREKDSSHENTREPNDLVAKCKCPHSLEYTRRKIPA